MVGDVNSTMVAAITAVKLRIPVAHVEVDLRSFDHTMPEEINRLVTESVSDYLCVREESGMHNLMVEWVDKCKLSFVGNGMIDSLGSVSPYVGSVYGEGATRRDQRTIRSHDAASFLQHGRSCHPKRPHKRDCGGGERSANPLSRPSADKETSCKTMQSCRHCSPLEATKSSMPGIHCMEPLGYRDESVGGYVAAHDRPSSQEGPFHAKPLDVASFLVGWTGCAEDCAHSIRASSLRDACHATLAVSIS